MELLLNFMYRGEINVEEDELMDLIATARGLSIRGLSDSDEDTTSNNSSTRQIPPSQADYTNNVPKNQKLSSKAVKRSKSPSQPSTSASEEAVIPSASKRIKQESSSAVEIAPEAIEGYDEDSGGGETGAVEEFANPDAVYAEGHQEEYNLEEGEDEEGMMFEGELPHPEVSFHHFFPSN